MIIEGIILLLIGIGIAMVLFNIKILRKHSVLIRVLLIIITGFIGLLTRFSTIIPLILAIPSLSLLISELSSLPARDANEQGKRDYRDVGIGQIINSYNGVQNPRKLHAAYAIFIVVSFLVGYSFRAHSLL
ncbi:MAG: hypothetical protein ACFFCS_27610, partial [Candidatus Hodarchaeota archaeon]